MLVSTQKLKSWRGLFNRSLGSSSSHTVTASDNGSLVSAGPEGSTTSHNSLDCKAIPLIHVDRLEIGRHTARFAKAADLVDTALMSGEGGAFSLFYELYDEQNRVVRLESLDLVVPDRHDYQVLTGAIKTLLKLVPEQMRLYVHDVQWLRYQYSLLSKIHHKPWEAPLSAPEWALLADHMGLGLPKAKVQQIFHHQVNKQQKEHNNSRDINNQAVVEWSKVAYLVQKAYRMQGTEASDPIAQIWKELIETDPVPIVTLDDSASFDSYELNVQEAEESISPVAMLGFLHKQQGEVQWKLEQVIELIHALNTHSMATDESYESLEDRRLKHQVSSTNEDNNEQSFAAGDRLCYERFRHYMLSGSNDLLDTTMQPQDMNQPLSHYYICSSHDTFLSALPDSWDSSDNGRRKNDFGPQHQVPTQMDANNYLQVLIRGVRCLGMTVWDSPNGKFPVLDRTSAAMGPPLRSVLEAIRYFVEEYQPKCFPVIVHLENHCSPAVQQVMAKEIKEILGDAVYRSKVSHASADFKLPTPREARGKVIIMAKRPKTVAELPSPKKATKRNALYVVHDDYDDENDMWDYVREPEETRPFETTGQLKSGPVIGFDGKGPIYAKDWSIPARSPSDLLKEAEDNLANASKTAGKTKMRSVQYEKAIEDANKEVESLAMKAGCTYEQIVQEVTKMSTGIMLEEEKSPKDEGVEIHEVLLSSSANRDNLKRIKKNLEAANADIRRKENMVRDATQQWKQWKLKSEKVLGTEDALLAEARKARMEATVRQEHANAAIERYNKVKSMVEQNNEISSSAETVVMTAMTEAKISEKRAAEAEARAAKAEATAKKDKARADTENRKEEELEQEVNEAAERCARASDKLQNAIAEMKKMSAQRKRVEEQIRLIQESSQFKLETSQRASGNHSSARHGGSFIEKHTIKTKELERVTATQKSMAQRLRQLEAEQQRLQKDFEEYNHLWKVQADIASKVRKVADRSAHIAEELAEHAEEEREAANLRLTAHERAEANVQKKGSQKQSLDTQLEQAKQAMDEANKLLAESRKKSEKLNSEAAFLTEGSSYRKELEQKERYLENTKAALEKTIKKKQWLEDELRHEKRRLQITGEIAMAAKEDEARQGEKIQVVSAYHEKAVNMYSQLLILQREAAETARQSREAHSRVEKKARIVRRAREYKVSMDRVTEIPPALANMTLLHTQKLVHWEKSQRLPISHAHSVAHHVLGKMVEVLPEDQIKLISDFTQSHICRVFPSWKNLPQQSSFNYDPVLPWKYGCQIVPMNYHVSDENLFVSEGFFRQNGSCGYVLKSPLLLGNNASQETQRWKITLLSGYSLPLPRKTSGRLESLKAVVRISVHVGDAGSAPYSYETAPSKTSGPNPTFEDELCELIVTEPATAMLTFTVWDKQDVNSRGLIGGASIPMSHLCEGYRSVLLFDSNHSRTGSHAYASLFVHAEKED